MVWNSILILTGLWNDSGEYMTKTKKISILCILISLFMLVGCGSEVPELTDEQMELVADYSAALLMKYDSQSPSRLLPEGYDSVDNTVTITRDLPEQEDEEVIIDNPEPEVSETDLDVIDNTTGETEKSDNHTEGFADHLAGTGINIEYSYWELLDSYPEDAGNLYFSVDASEGNRLLVVHFLLSCTEGDMKQVNMTDYSLKYRVSLNGGSKKKIMTTMLDNDILTFKGTVVPDQMIDIVAVAEIREDEAESINSIVLTIKGKEFSTTMQLQ